MVQSSTEPRETPCELLLRLAKPGLVPNSTEDGHIRKLAFMCCEYLRHRMVAFLRENGDEPIMISYQNDATPGTTHETFCIELGGKRIVKKGERSNEFLLHRTFARTPDHRQCVCFGYPQRLSDKTVPTHIQAARPFLFYPFKHGARSISITHVCFDGALWDPLSRMIYSDHSMAIDSEGASEERDLNMLELCAWFVRTPCVLHNCHNSMKWALGDFLSDSQFMKDTWSVVAALRSCFGSLEQYISLWVSARLAFREPGDAEQLQTLWELIGYEADLIADLVRLELLFVDGTLFVSEAFVDSPTIHTEIYMVLIRAFRVQEWSESRWLGASKTARAMLGALLLGAQEFSQFAVSRGHSTYCLGNFSKLNSRMRQFFVCCGCGAYPVECCMAICMDDDRLCRVLPTLEHKMEEGIFYLSSIDPSVWQVLSECVGMPSQQLRSEALEAAHVSSGYFFQRLAVARELPWSLLGGSAEEALQSFEALEDPEEEVSRKSKALAEMGMERQELVKAISLLQCVGWSTNATEQGHSAASRVIRHHDCCTATLQVRSVLWQARALYQRDEAIVELEKSKSKLHKLQEKVPNRIGAKQAFVSELLCIAATDSFRSRHPGENCGKMAVQRHAAIWRDMPSAAKSVYQRRALELRCEKQEQLDEALSIAIADVRSHRQAVEDAKVAKDIPARFTACRLSDRERTQFDELWHDSRFARSRLNELRAIAEELVLPVSQVEKDALEGARQLARPPVLPVWDWVKEMARLRKHLHKCIIKLQDAEGARYFKFLFAVLSPHIFIGFSEVFVESEDPVLLALAFHSGAPVWEHNFVFVPGIFCFTNSDSDAFPEHCEVFVLDDVAFVSAARLCSVSSFEPWDVFARRIPEEARDGRPPAASHATDRKQKSSLVVDNPWLADILGGAGGGSGGGRHSGSKRGSESHAGDKPIVEEDLDRDEVLASLAAAREAIADAPMVAEIEHFSWTLRGGCWTREHTGMDYDSFRAMAVTKPGKEFLAQSGMPASATFAMQRYGEHACAVFCRYWVARMSFLKGLSDSAQGGGAEVFCDAALGAFQEPADFVELASSARGHVLSRIRALRALRPA